MIRVTGVTKHYGTFRALDHLHVAIGRGEFVVFLGPNGSGKSTLYRCLLGITAFDVAIQIAEKDPLLEGKAVRSMIGYMPQNTSLHEDMTVEETLGFYSELRNDSKANAHKLLERTGLGHTLSVKVGELSGGMKQRLAFATALIGDPELLLLDEPTANLDEQSQLLLQQWLMELKEQGKTIVVSTHFQTGVLSLADRSITLEHGRISYMTQLDHQSSREFLPLSRLSVAGA